MRQFETRFPAQMRRLATTLVLASIGLFCLQATSCTNPRALRSGQVLQPGHFRVGAHLGGSFGDDWVDTGDFAPGITNIGLHGQVGIYKRLELVGDLSWFKQLIGARFDITNAHRGEYVSSSVSAGVAYQPYRGAELSGGLDISVPIGWFEPIVNLSILTGDQWFRIRNPSYDPQAESNSDSPSNETLVKVRNETRFQALFGFAINIAEDPAPTDEEYGRAGGSLMFGAGPFWILSSDRSSDRDKDGMAGVVFTLGVTMGNID